MPLPTLCFLLPSSSQFSLKYTLKNFNLPQFIFQHSLPRLRPPGHLSQCDLTPKARAFALFIHPTHRDQWWRWDATVCVGAAGPSLGLTLLKSGKQGERQTYIKESHNESKVTTVRGAAAKILMMLCGFLGRSPRRNV